jgi:4-hydroxy-2-oxoheptanedioate aldolase
VAGSGFDWLLLDMEHSPNEFDMILQQLQMLAGYSSHAIVRPVWNDPRHIKRLLDIGAQTLLIPFVQNADQARAAVKAMRYPPEGIRGVSALTRATRFGRIPEYAQKCQDELCLLVQVETPEAIQNIKEIAAIDGVDGIFIGPGDLSASMGYVGQTKHPEVLKVIDQAILDILASGKAPGMITTDQELAKHYIELGTLFTAVGIDTSLLVKAADELAKKF